MITTSSLLRRRLGRRPKRDSPPSVRPLVDELTRADRTAGLDRRDRIVAGRHRLADHDGAEDLALHAGALGALVDQPRLAGDVRLAAVRAVVERLVCANNRR